MLIARNEWVLNCEFFFHPNWNTHFSLISEHGKMANWIKWTINIWFSHFDSFLFPCLKSYLKLSYTILVRSVFFVYNLRARTVGNIPYFACMSCCNVFFFFFFHFYVKFWCFEFVVFGLAWFERKRNVVGAHSSFLMICSVWILCNDGYRVV